MTRYSYQHKTLDELMELVEGHYLRNGFDSSQATLMCGVMEEVGELAECILARQDDYKTRDNKEFGVIEYEVGDIIVYLLAICNRHGLVPEFRNLHSS